MTQLQRKGVEGKDMYISHLQDQYLETSNRSRRLHGTVCAENVHQKMLQLLVPGPWPFLFNRNKMWYSPDCHSLSTRRSGKSTPENRYKTRYYNLRHVDYDANRLPLYNRRLRGTVCAENFHQKLTAAVGSWE